MLTQSRAAAVGAAAVAVIVSVVACGKRAAEALPQALDDGRGELGGVVVDAD